MLKATVQHINQQLQLSDNTIHLNSYEPAWFSGPNLQNQKVGLGLMSKGQDGCSGHMLPDRGLSKTVILFEGQLSGCVFLVFVYPFLGFNGNPGGNRETISGSP